MSNIPKVINRETKHLSRAQFKKYLSVFKSLGYNIQYKNNKVQKKITQKLKHKTTKRIPIGYDTIRIKDGDELMSMREASLLIQSEVTIKKLEREKKKPKDDDTIEDLSEFFPKDTLLVKASIYRLEYHGQGTPQRTLLLGPTIQIELPNGNMSEAEEKKHIAAMLEEKAIALTSGYPFDIVMGSSTHDEEKELNKVDPELRITVDDIKKKSIKKVKMKHTKMNYFLLGGDSNANWDSQEQQCVLDYLLYTYKGTECFKKLTMAKLKADFPGYEEGIDMQQIDAWCRKKNISHYGLDPSNKVVMRYAPNRNKMKYRPLIYKCNNSHLYPIDSENLRKLIMNAAPNTDGTFLKSLKLPYNKKKVFKIPSKYDIYANQFHEFLQDFKAKGDIFITDKVLYADDQLATNLDVVVSSICDQQKTIPDSLNVNREGHILACNVGEKLLVYEPKYDLIMEALDGIQKSNLFNDQEKQLFSTYNGQSFSQLMNQIIDLKFHKLPAGSRYNNQTEEFMKAYCMTPWLETFKVTPKLAKGFINVGIDRKSSYTDIIYNKQSPWLVFDELCQVKAFADSEAEDQYIETDTLPYGHYIVIKPDLTLGPLNIGNSRWSSECVEFLLRENLIELEHISCYLEPRSFLPADMFKSPIDFVNNLEFGKNSRQIRKDLINTLNGSFGKTQGHVAKAFITNCRETAVGWYVDCSEPATITTLPQESQLQSNSLYKCVERRSYERVSNRPWFDEVIQLSVIKLYQMIKFVQTVPSTNLIGVRNDCCYVQVKESEFKKLKLKPDALHMGEYRIDSFHPVKFNRRKLKKCELEGFEWTNPGMTAVVKGTSADRKVQKKVKELVKNNSSMLIQAPAGYGKSWLLQNVIKPQLDKDKKTYLVTALSDKACSNLRSAFPDVVNISSSLRKRPFESDWQHKKRVSKYQTIIIDEYSMIPFREMSNIITLVNELDIQVIIAGDKAQIPPPNKINIDYWTNVGFKELVGFNLVQLEYNSNFQTRYDARTNEFLAHFRKTGKFLFDLPVKENSPENYKQMNITWLNSSRRTINNEMKPENLEVGTKLIANAKSKVEGKKYFRKQYFTIISIDDEEAIAEEAPVAFVAAAHEEETPTMYTLQDDDDAAYTIELTEREIKRDFEYGYAITADSSQCSTIEVPYTISDLGKMSRRRLYTALSRCKSIDQITLLGEPKSKYHNEKFVTQPLNLISKPTLQGYIYALVNKSKQVVYCGSTTNPTKRKEQHAKTYPNNTFKLLKSSKYLDRDALEREEVFFIKWFYASQSVSVLKNKRGLKTVTEQEKAILKDLKLLDEPYLYEKKIEKVVPKNRIYKDGLKFRAMYEEDGKTKKKQFKTREQAQAFLDALDTAEVETEEVDQDEPYIEDIDVNIDDAFSLFDQIDLETPFGVPDYDQQAYAFLDVQVV